MTSRRDRTKDSARRLARRALSAGRRVTGRGEHPQGVMDNLDPGLAHDIGRCQPYTMTSAERLLATSEAVEYAVRRGLPGALVECGVWKGGSTLAMIYALQRLGVSDREIWLYDTFEGMTEPTEHDTSAFEKPASSTWADAAAKGRRAFHQLFRAEEFGLEQVRSTILASGYPEHLIHFVVGPVEKTLPGEIPEQIAVLRLDTDWYESTLHEMNYLYPRLVSGGVLLIDDYGHWEGARKAVDEYLADQGEVLLLHRTDYTGRATVKA